MEFLVALTREGVQQASMHDYTTGPLMLAGPAVS